MLPLECSDCASVNEAIARESATKASVLTWTGHACHSVALNESGTMLTTSAFRSVAVATVRHKTFTNLVGDMTNAIPEQLRDFHWYEGDDGATGIRMSRPDACTHSISYVTVSMDEKVAHYHYSPQSEISPNERSSNHRLRLLDQGTFNKSD